MAKDALVEVINRNAFYQRLHYLALFALLLAIVVIGILSSVLLYVSGNFTKPLYFATDNVGRLIKIIPANQPNMNREDVLAWAIEAVQSAYSYDYVNYRQQLQSAQKYFTIYGWQQYMSALTASNNVIAVTERKMVVVAKVVDKPQVLTEGVLQNALAWQIRLPVLVTYILPPYDEQSKYSNAVTVTLIVKRQSMLDSYKGLGIVQLVGTLATAPLANQPQQITNLPAS